MPGGALTWQAGSTTDDAEIDEPPAAHRALAASELPPPSLPEHHR